MSYIERHNGNKPSINGSIAELKTFGSQRKMDKLVGKILRIVEK